MMNNLVKYGVIEFSRASSFSCASRKRITSDKKCRGQKKQWNSSAKFFSFPM